MKNNRGEPNSMGLSEPPTTWWLSVRFGQHLLLKRIGSDDTVWIHDQDRSV